MDLEAPSSAITITFSSYLFPIVKIKRILKQFEEKSLSQPTKIPAIANKIRGGQAQIKYAPAMIIGIACTLFLRLSSASGA